MTEFRLPQGMRDLIPEDCLRKQKFQGTIEGIFNAHGYQPVQTPAVEYYETYRSAFGTVKDREMYKFLDQDGEILTMRADMTVPIARLCATKYAQARPPFRFRYCADVFKVRELFAGKRAQVTDCGIELIGEDSRSDTEVLAIALEVMDHLGLSGWQLEIGNTGFFRRACGQLGITEQDAAVLADLIDRKSLVDLKSCLDGYGLAPEGRRLLEALPLLGGSDALERAEQLSFSGELRQEVNALRQLEQALSRMGYGERISCDFGKVPHLNYYTGIIFEGYASGAGVAVLSGGRYDSLLQRFGRDLPACGFSVKLDYLMDAEKGETE